MVRELDHERISQSTGLSDKNYSEVKLLWLSGFSLVPIRCGLFIDKSLAEFENPQQNCTTTSGAFRSTTPVTLCDVP